MRAMASDLSRKLGNVITPSRIDSAMQHVEWLRIALHDKELPATLRVRASVSCLAIAQEHHHSTVLLIDHRLHASAFALMRVGFESYIRGMWLALCASEAEVECFLEGDEPPKLGVLLIALEQTEGFTEQVLSKIKCEHWSAMCAFTHTGGIHVQRWNTAEAIEPNYDLGEIAQVLFFAELIGSLSVLGVAEVANDVELASRVLAQVKSHIAGSLNFPWDALARPGS